MIKLGLYSRAARAVVDRARTRIAELGLGAAPEDMREFRRRVLEGHEPALAPLTRSLDFYTLSTVRDLLFHVQEHQLDLPGVEALVAGRGLRILGFLVAPGVRRRYLAQHPDDPRLAAIESLHAFETAHPDTFAGMYQLYCTRAHADP